MRVCLSFILHIELILPPIYIHYNQSVFVPTPPRETRYVVTYYETDVHIEPIDITSLSF